MELNQITAILAEVLGTDPSKVEPSAHLTDDLGLDSLDLTQIWMKIEEIFNIEVDAALQDRPETVQDIADVTASLLKPSEGKRV